MKRQGKLEALVIVLLVVLLALVTDQDPGMRDIVHTVLRWLVPL